MSRQGADRKMKTVGARADESWEANTKRQVKSSNAINSLKLLSHIFFNHAIRRYHINIKQICKEYINFCLA